MIFTGLHQGPMCLLQRHNQLDSWLCLLFGEILSISPLRAQIDGKISDDNRSLKLTHLSQGVDGV
jgi:hypothetical protein